MEKIEAVKTYLKEVRAELNKVTWTGRKEVVSGTIAVLVLSGVVSLFNIDFGLSYGQARAELIVCRKISNTSGTSSTHSNYETRPRNLLREGEGLSCEDYFSGILVPSNRSRKRRRGRRNPEAGGISRIYPRTHGAY